MRTPLAWLNLAHYKMRTLAAVAGVAFSVVLIFMQLGFLGSVETTASLLYDALEFDLVMRSPQYLHVAAPGTFPRGRLYHVASRPGVESASDNKRKFSGCLPGCLPGKCPTGSAVLVLDEGIKEING